MLKFFINFKSLFIILNFLFFFLEVVSLLNFIGAKEYSTIIMTVLGQRHLPYSATPSIGSPTTSALAAGSTYLFTSVLATPFPFP